MCEVSNGNTHRNFQRLPGGWYKTSNTKQVTRIVPLDNSQPVWHGPKTAEAVGHPHTKVSGRVATEEPPPTGIVLNGQHPSPLDA